ncbi:malonate decarboxylase holo-ACP synthase [Paenibacillus sp. sgz500992]|uniref:malonate decarboxylase holo-ACP synthase n=1 Tax=Paenibacillus sp. sgz500992 TaxID=3242476 RepID=UPI0036D26D46
MELNPHDLVRFRNIDSIIFDSPQPPWAIQSLMKAPFVVVRRAPILGCAVPVGIRGNRRNQRSAATIEIDNIIERVSPEELAFRKSWRTNKHLQEIGISYALEFVDSILTQEGISWGPTGSIGYELASGINTATKNSDMDIIIRVSECLPVNTSKQLMNRLLQTTVKVDVQLETLKGCVILAEYARGESSIMLRTTDGPRLVESQSL